MLISMFPHFMIVSQLSMRYGKPRTYVEDLIKRVHDDWAINAAAIADTRRHQVRHGFEKIMMIAAGKKDAAGHPTPALDVMVRVQRELGLLDGCYVPNTVNVNHTGAVGVGISLGGLGFKSPEEVAARVDELRARLAAQGPGALSRPAGSAQALPQLITQTQDANVIEIDPDPGGD